MRIVGTFNNTVEFVIDSGLTIVDNTTYWMTINYEEDDYEGF